MKDKEVGIRYEHTELYFHDMAVQVVLDYLSICSRENPWHRRVTHYDASISLPSHLHEVLDPTGTQ